MHTPVTPDQFSNWLRKVENTFPNTIEWFARLPNDRVPAVKAHWLQEINLRGISIAGLHALLERLGTSDLIGTGEFKPWAILHYVLRYARPHKLYTEWAEAGAIGTCPTLLTDPTEYREAIARLNSLGAIRTIPTPAATAHAVAKRKMAAESVSITPIAPEWAGQLRHPHDQIAAAARTIPIS